MPRSNGEAREEGPIKSVALTLRILETLANSDTDRGVTELARELGCTKARIFRHLRTLRHLGYVAQDPRTDRNQMGSRLYLLGRIVAERFDLVRAVRPAMESVRAATAQTTVFSAVLDEQVTILDLLRGTDPVEIGLKLGSAFPLHATAQGKIALAYGEGADAAHSGRRLARLTTHTVTAPERLRTQLETIRREGWAIAPQETLIGVNALAAPVFAHDGALVGAIAIVGSIQYIPAPPEAGQIESVRYGGRLASEALGWRAG